MPRQQGNRRSGFLLAPGMPFGKRITYIAVLVGTGILVQLLIGCLLGWPLILAGCLLSAMHRIRTKPMDSPPYKWQNADISELERIVTIPQRTSGRGRRPYDILASSGCWTCVVSAIAIVFAPLIIVLSIRQQLPSVDFAPNLIRPILDGGSVLAAWGLDASTILFIFWFAGSISVWEPPHIAEKAEYLYRIYLKFSDDHDLEFQPSLLMAKSRDRWVPFDCRMQVRLKSAPPEFIGIQIQVAMNSYKDKMLPYCYSVLLAQRGFGLQEKVTPHVLPPGDDGWRGLGAWLTGGNAKREVDFSHFDDSVVEEASDRDVEVVVVRQVTTASMGFRTTQGEAEEVFRDALKLARLILSPQE